MRDISEVLSELEEQEEPKEESNNDSDKFVIVDDDVGDNTSDRPSPKLVTIKISHCYKVYRKGCNRYKLFDVIILLQHLTFN